MNNTKSGYDIASYDCCDYQRSLYDPDTLFDAFLHARSASGWKAETQRFELNLLRELLKLSKELKNRTYRPTKKRPFILSERGKIRYIVGDHIRDRVVKRALCYEHLLPAVRPMLIHDNGASLKGKGMDFTRRRLEQHLRSFYRSNGSNDGYIAVLDCSKYFANIRHDIMRDLFKAVIKDETALWLLDVVFKESEVDVSYMSDDEYSNCIDTVFDSVHWAEVDEKLLTGKKHMAKGMNIGDEVAQVAGIYYPTALDKYIKIVEGMRFYGRYMDDMYIIHKDKDFLEHLIGRVVGVAKDNGIFINPKKTKIIRLDSNFTFLKIRYRITESGRLLRQIDVKRIRDLRRRLKKLVTKMTFEEMQEYYTACYNDCKRLMSNKQRLDMERFAYRLMEEHYVQDYAS